ncbi:MAG: hypothetical protein OQK12_18235 [Motiliproteus sp.]|nr:hypothetical protein [Motiliproteus sp.]MCW9054008.1 hypothetical protein [Motiliproteus sp.]
MKLSFKRLGVGCCIVTLCTAILSLRVYASPENASSPAADLSQVIWSRTDFAPFFILEGEYQNRGIGDTVIKLFVKEISGYHHKPVKMTIRRMLSNARRAIPTCHVVLLRNDERERYIEYSNPIMINYANGLITSSAGLNLFGMSSDAIGLVDLHTLVGKPLQISVHDGRSYSPVVDGLVAHQRKLKESIFLLKTGQKETQQLIKQTLANRLDGFIARPEEVYFHQVVSQVKQPLYFVEIKDQPNTSLVRVGCTKGDWNNQLMTQINALLKRPAIRQAINDAYLQWLPEQLRKNYLSEQAKIFEH